MITLIKDVFGNIIFEITRLVSFNNNDIIIINNIEYVVIKKIINVDINTKFIIVKEV